MSMYLYTIEKTLSNNYTMSDIQSLNGLMTNADNIHHLLGKLFNVDKEENWRSKYNILYKTNTESTFKLVIKSDIQISKEAINDNGFKLLSEKEIDIKDNQKIALSITVSPFRKDGGQKTKRIIKTTEERIAWLKNKLTHNGECIINEINEINQNMNYMEHPDKLKGAVMLCGYNYKISLTVKDKDGFLKLIQTGIGPQKNYGFGLLEVV